MDVKIAETTIKACLSEICQRLDSAASVARAAQLCVDAGSTEKGIEIALDIEPIVHEVATLLNAASLVHRISDD